jgi:hypothetical protein
MTTPKLFAIIQWPQDQHSVWFSSIDEAHSFATFLIDKCGATGAEYGWPRQWVVRAGRFDSRRAYGPGMEDLTVVSLDEARALARGAA